MRTADTLENDMADAASDFGRRRQLDVVFDARRLLVRARGIWIFLFAHLHGYFIAVSRTVVDHDGCGGVEVRWIAAVVPDLPLVLGRVVEDVDSLEDMSEVREGADHEETDIGENYENIKAKVVSCTTNRTQGGQK